MEPVSALAWWRCASWPFLASHCPFFSFLFCSSPVPLHPALNTMLLLAATEPLTFSRHMELVSTELLHWSRTWPVPTFSSHRVVLPQNVRHSQWSPHTRSLLSFPKFPMPHLRLLLLPCLSVLLSLSCLKPSSFPPWSLSCSPEMCFHFLNYLLHAFLTCHVSKILIPINNTCIYSTHSVSGPILALDVN